MKLFNCLCHQTLCIYDGPMFHHLLDKHTASVGMMTSLKFHGGLLVGMCAN